MKDYRSIQKPPLFKYSVRSNIVKRAEAIVRKPLIQSRPKAIAPPPKPNQQLHVRSTVVAPRKPIKLPKKPIIIDVANKPVLSLKDAGKGRILIIIANGPSINEIDYESLQTLIKETNKIDTLSINNPHNNLWPTKYWMFADNTQYNRFTDIFNSYEGIIINTSAIRKRRRNQVIIKYLGGKGFSRDLTKGFYLGRSTTFAAMQVALYMNYDKIFIFGMDMTDIGGKLHYYGQNPDVSNDTRKSRFKMEAVFYDYAARNILTPQERIKFYICSQYNPFEFVELFNRISTSEVITTIKDNIPV